MCFARVPRRRVEEWLRVLNEISTLPSKLVERLGKVTLILYGSYARGDFNLWSDVDLLVISERFEGIRPLDRYDLVKEVLPSRAEAILFTPKEMRICLKKPVWRQALTRGAVIVHDDYGFEGELQARRIRTIDIVSFIEQVRKLLENTVEV